MATQPVIAAVEQEARRRIAKRLLPFLFLLYLVAYLDRVNISFAALVMSRQLSFTDRIFGLGSGIFFIGYFLFEIPGALLVERWSARRWIARILFTWGAFTMLMSLVHTTREFYAVRFLLGLAEAGFFPGIIVYLTHWFRREDRARACAFFITAIPAANIVGSPFAGWLLGVHWFGFDGWRWMFILEGLPAVLLGFATLAWLTDWPRQARWLRPEEQEWINSELEREKKEVAASHYTIREALAKREVLLLTLIYFLGIMGLYGFNFWFPTILKRATGLPNFTVTLLAAMPYILGFFALIWNGLHSDRSGERRWHTAIPLFCCGGFLALAVALNANIPVSLGAMILAGAFTSTFMPTFWALPSLVLTESAAAASIGLINSVGNLGGFVGPYFIGYFGTVLHSFSPGLMMLVVSLFASGILVLTLRFGHSKPPH